MSQETFVILHSAHYVNMQLNTTYVISYVDKHVKDILYIWYQQRETNMNSFAEKRPKFVFFLTEPYMYLD